MNDRIKQLRRRKRLFGGIFVISTILFLTALYLTPAQSQSKGPGAGSDGSWIGVVLATTGSFGLTGIVGLVFNWRKDKRETQLSALEIEKAELELKKLKQEMDEN